MNIITHRIGRDSVTAYCDIPATPGTAFANIHLLVQEGATRAEAESATASLFDALSSFYEHRATGAF